MGISRAACFGVVFAAVISAVYAQERHELPLERLEDVIGDFLHEIDQLERGSGMTNGTHQGRRLQQFFGSTLDFSDLTAEDIVGEFLDNFDIVVSLSDFLDGIFQTPALDILTDLPQSQEEAEAVIKAKYNEFCDDPQKTIGGEMDASCTGWVTKIELQPAKCVLVNRENQEFECDPAMLVYTKEAPTCTGEHRAAAEFISQECKIIKSKGIGQEVVLGGGSFDIVLRKGTQNIDIFADLDIGDLVGNLDLGDLF